MKAVRESRKAAMSASASLRAPAEKVVPAQVRTLDSVDLLKGAKQVEISHQGQHYTLRLTRLGKLILTK